MMDTLADSIMLLNLITFRLDDSNFAKWSFQIELVLGIHDLFGFVDGSKTCPAQYEFDEGLREPTGISEEIRLWSCTDKLVLSLIIASMSFDAVYHIIGSKTSREAWLNIVEHYASRSRSNIFQLKQDLVSISKDGNSIEQYLLKYKRARAKLSVVGVEISDEDIIVFALNGLPKEYDTIKLIITTRESDISMVEFRSHLLVAEKIIENQKLSMSTGASVLHCGADQHLQSGRDSTFELLYRTIMLFRAGFVLGKTHGTNYGGTVKKDFSRINNFRRSNGHIRTVQCQICDKNGHVALDCYRRSNYPVESTPWSTSVATITTQASCSNDLQIEDTDTTYHMSSNEHTLIMLQPVQEVSIYTSYDKIPAVETLLTGSSYGTDIKTKNSAQKYGLAQFIRPMQTKSKSTSNGVLVHDTLEVDMKNLDKVNCSLDIQGAYSIFYDIFINKSKYIMELIIEEGMDTCKCSVLNDDGALPFNLAMCRILSAPQLCIQNTLRDFNLLQPFIATDWDGDPKVYKWNSISCQINKQQFDVRSFVFPDLTWLFLPISNFCSMLEYTIWIMVHRARLGSKMVSCSIFFILLIK